MGPCLLGTSYFTIQQLPISPLWNAVERVLPAALVLLLLFPALPRGRWWARSLALGVLNFGACFALQAFASHRLPGAVVATIIAAQALLVPALATAFGERIGVRQLVAALVGVCGVALLVLRGDQGLDGVGVAAAAVMAGVAALGLLFTRRWGTPAGVHHISATAWQMIVGSALLLPLAGALEGAPPAFTTGQAIAAGWLTLAATAAAFAFYFGGLHDGLSSTTVSRLLLLSPLVASALGWLFAGEALGPVQLVGIAMVLGAQLVGAPRSTPEVQIPLPRRPEDAGARDASQRARSAS